MIRKLIAFIKTDYLLEFAYPLSWVFFLGLPILFTLIIGVALGGTQSASSSNEDTRPKVLVIDLDQTDSSRHLVTTISNQTAICSSFVSSPEAAETEQNQTNYSGILTIPTGFEKALHENKVLALPLKLGQSGYETIAVENTLRTALHHTTAVWQAARGSLIILSEKTTLSEEQYQTQMTENLEQAEKALSEPAVTYTKNESDTPSKSTEILNGFNQSSAGQLVTWTLITLLGGSTVFVMERENGTFQRLMTTPTSRFTYFAGKLFSRLSMGLIQMCILVMFGSYVLHVNWGDDPVTLLLFLTCFSFTGTALGLMLGSLAKTAKQAEALTPVFSMLLASLGGAWWPLEITPPLYQTIVRVLPTTWAMMGFSDIIIKHQGLVGVLPEMLVILGFGIFFSAIGIANLNRKGNR